MTDAATRGPEAVRTVFVGSGAFGVPALERLAAHVHIRLVGVVTAPPRPSGRHRVLTPTPIAARAADLGLPAILAPERLRDPAAIDAVLGLDPALVVLADYGQLVPEALLDVPLGALNLHPSLLPRHRGAIPIPAAIMEGDPETGVTLMRMDTGLDTGPIVGQVRQPLRGDETAPGLEELLAATAAALLNELLDPWIAGRLDAVPQPEAGATLTRPLRRSDGRLDPTLPAVTLERRVRALQPWPGSFLEQDGERVVVLEAHVAGGGSAAEPGSLDIVDGSPALHTGDGLLVLDRVTPAGRRPMAGSEWLRGRRVPESAR